MYTHIIIIISITLTTTSTTTSTSTSTTTNDKMMFIIVNMIIVIRRGAGLRRVRGSAPGLPHPPPWRQVLLSL